MLKYKIEKGFDHYKTQKIYRVLGINNEYVGEWCINKKDCKNELNLLIIKS